MYKFQYRRMDLLWFKFYWVDFEPEFIVAQRRTTILFSKLQTNTKVFWRNLRLLSAQKKKHLNYDFKIKMTLSVNFFIYKKFTILFDLAIHFFKLQEEECQPKLFDDVTSSIVLIIEIDKVHIDIIVYGVVSIPNMLGPLHWCNR